MGAGPSIKKRPTDADNETNDFLSAENDLQLYLENYETMIPTNKNWIMADTFIVEGLLKVKERDKVVFELDLTTEEPKIDMSHSNQSYELIISVHDKKVRIKDKDKKKVETWMRLLNFQIMMSSNDQSFASNLRRTSHATQANALDDSSIDAVDVIKVTSSYGRGNSYIVNESEKFSKSMSALDVDMSEDEINSILIQDGQMKEYKDSDFKIPENYMGITAPKMNIVILVVGTRGDVQPFAYFGQCLQKDGHRVRLATHAEYRDDVIKKGGLEYYPLAGDPRKLSEYMVKSGGRLIPDLLSKEERLLLPEKLKMLKEICYSCWPAVSEPDPEDPEKKPFIADAIISNPVAYGHIHCAQKLRIPLHIMFPQPWSPTMCFPHPLSNLALVSKWSSKNYYSYFMVNELMWLGLGGMINQFRQEILGLPSIKMRESGQSFLEVHKVPISHMWSPCFVPKCPDWPKHVDVVGEFRNMTVTASTAYKPSDKLQSFVSAGEKPIYIGFGSMVIDDATKLVSIIKESAASTKCRVLLQSGWTKYADDETMISDEVMVIGAMPHDYLFTTVAGVIHHGGAGTTSAGLRAGNPTFICPFFGDQHFWAEMVYRSGAGPKGCPINKLTVDKLSNAFIFMRDANTITKAKELGAKMSAEDGCAAGVNSFYRNLPLDKMICDVSIFHNQKTRLASVYCYECDLKMCHEVDAFVHRSESLRQGHTRKPYKYNSQLDELHKTIDKKGLTKQTIGNRIRGLRDQLFATPMATPKSGSFHWNSTKDILNLTPEEIELEHAFSKTLGFRQFYKVLDNDNSNSVDEQELTKVLSVSQAKELMSMVDWNGDRVLSFNELAWLSSQQDQSNASVTSLKSISSRRMSRSMMTVELGSMMAVQLEELDFGMSTVLDVDDKGVASRIIVTSVIDGGEAERKGVHVGDQILSCNCDVQTSETASNIQQYWTKLQEDERPLIITFMKG